MATNQVDALAIFAATGDLAKTETFPALVGLVEPGVPDVPVVGVARSAGKLHYGGFAGRCDMPVQAFSYAEPQQPVVSGTKAL